MRLERPTTLWWLVALHFLSPGAALDLERLRPSSHGIRTPQLLPKEALRLEAAALQRKIDEKLHLVDDALMAVSQQQGHLRADKVAKEPLSLAATTPRRMLQNTNKARLYTWQETVSRAQSSGTPISVLQNSMNASVAFQGSVNESGRSLSGTNVRGASRGWDLGEQLEEWIYDGPRTIPRRNKLVLAAIEMIPPLGVFGMDRLYLGQPVLAVAKMLSFFCTFGVVGSIWALFDAWVIAQNCILESQHLEQFGMAAWFTGEEWQMQVAAVMGLLIVLIWVLHIIYLAVMAYRSIQQGGRFHRAFVYLTQGKEEELAVDGLSHKMENLKRDPFMSSCSQQASLKADPFLSRLPPHSIPDGGAHPHTGYCPVEADQHSQRAYLTHEQRDRMRKAPLHNKKSSLGRWYRQDEAGDYMSDEA